MASVVAQYHSQSAGGAGANIVVSATPAAGEVVYIALLGNRSTARTVSSISGLGATWTEVHNSGTSRYILYKGTGASASGTVTITLSGTQTTATSAWIISGADAGTLADASFTTAAASTSLAGPSQGAGSGQVVLATAMTTINPTTFPSAQTPSSSYTAATGGTFSGTAYAAPGSTASHQASASVGSAGSLWVGQSVVGSSAPAVTASLSGSGVLSATVVEVEQATASLTGSGALSAAVVPVESRAAALTGSGVLAATVVAVIAVSASLTGSGNLSATTATAISASLAGTGTLSAVVEIAELGEVDANLSGSGVLSATVAPVHVAAASLAGSGALTADVVPSLAVSADLSGTGSLTAAVEVVSAMIPVDLSTFIDPAATASWDGTTLTGSPLTVLFPGQILDPAVTYTVEIDYEHNGSAFDGHASLHAALSDSDFGSYGQLAINAPLSGTGTTTLTIGPGLGDWNTYVLAGEQFLVYQFYNLDITGIRISQLMDGVVVTPPATTTDADNDAYKLTLGGWGVAAWEPAVVLAPLVGVRHAVISAIAYGPVAMQGTQPVFTYSEADRPRLRQRILLGGHDVTYDRDVPTPDVEYELADLLLYGPGTLDLPQYVAFTEVGTDVSDLWSEGRRVKVQLVDDFTDPESPTIEATIYKGFVLNPSVSGRNLSLELGGEAGGRLGLLDSHVLFRDVLDISRLLWRELTDAGVRYLPRLGGDGIGIKSLNFGGTGKLEKVEELLARAVKKDGTQRAVLPDADGAYRITDKDTETIHFTVFVDDAFTVPDLSSDLAEKPRTIYATAIDPDGMRIDGAAVPGLISTPAPDYPMDDNSNFGEGATNEDTDSGDGVSVMINRLGAVGLMTVHETPGGFDEDVADALAKLQRKANLTGPVGVMTPALWRALWDLDATGRSGRWSSIQPTAQDPSVQRYLRAASGAVIGLNPDFDEDAIDVHESIDMGSGQRERQVQNWSETRVHTPGTKVWYGTITVHLGAVLAGQVDVGATITGADLVDARLVQPGRHNLWVPNFDGGTMFGVSGVQVRGDSVVFTVDTRFRPAREIWERLQVRRETRNDPARRMLGTRQSTQRKDAVRGFISWGGLIDRDVPLEPGWNVIEVVVGDHGTIAWIETVVQSISGTGGDIVIDGKEYALALFGKPITAARLNALVPAPLTTEGEKAWRRRASRKELNEHGFLVAFGTQEEPCGYGEDIKSDAAPLTGRFVDDAGVRYDVEGYVARLGIYVRDDVTDAKLLKGRVMWPVLEGGV